MTNNGQSIPKYLFIRHNRVTSLSRDYIEGLKELLKILYADNNGIHDMPDLSYITKLMKITFDYNYIFTSLQAVATVSLILTWWRHQMETFSALLAICAGNLPVTDEFPAQRPVARSFVAVFDLRLNKRLSKQSWRFIPR